MAGYALECALKATLMREWRVATLSGLEDALARKTELKQSLFSHDIEMLFGLTRLGRQVLENPVPTPHDRQLARWFRACNVWVVSWRYSGSQGSQVDCEHMLSAAQPLVARIRAST